MKLAYDGRRFHGWQRQPNAVSVQQTLEEALQTVLRCPCPIVGAGRTDTGVNARVMYAHFEYPSSDQMGHSGQVASVTEVRNTLDLADPAVKARIVRGLNKLCGPDIAIHDIIPVADDAHARFDATARTYKYFITFQKDPFLNQFSLFCPNAPDMMAMNEAAAYLPLFQDFTYFAKLHGNAKTNICKVTEAKWTPWENDYGTPGIVFTITADRFLRNMVRAIVGTLVDVGLKNCNLHHFVHIIESQDRGNAGTSMPPQALFLWDIKYPYL